MANLVISAAGAGIGYLIGGPTGAQIGWVIGSSVAAGNQTIDQRQVMDMKVATAAYGAPMKYVIGKQRVSPNIIWADEKKTYTIEKKQGKGGPTVKTNGYTISLALGVCPGPVAGISKVWANEKLIIDSSVESKPLIGQFYPGNMTQMPDPTMEAILGAGNVPAYRGLCYIVLKDFDITGYGGVVPNISVEVCKGAEL